MLMPRCLFCPGDPALTCFPLRSLGFDMPTTLHCTVCFSICKVFNTCNWVDSCTSLCPGGLTTLFSNFCHYTVLCTKLPAAPPTEQPRPGPYHAAHLRKIRPKLRVSTRHGRFKCRPLQVPLPTALMKNHDSSPLTTAKTTTAATHDLRNNPN